MNRPIHTLISFLVLTALAIAGCATSGQVAESDDFDDEFGGGSQLPPVLAQRPTPGDGASLYSAHCGRCHLERWPTERTDAQWTTIMLHMRGISDVPGADAEAILNYLRSSN